MSRILAILLAIGVFVSPHIASACGVWHMKDVEKKLDISWLINAGSISSAKGRVAALYLDEDKKAGLRVVADKKVIFDYNDRKIRKYGKPVATLDDNSLTIGKKVFAFEFTDPREWHGFPSWKVTVKVGDKVVVESEQASALCAAAGKNMIEADQRHEIRLRMAYYIVWRELGV